MKKKFLSVLFVLLILLSVVFALGTGASAVDYVAKVGDTSYLTFAEAVAAAAEGGKTIELLADVTLTADCEIPDQTTIALKGNHIDKGSHAFTVGSGFVLEIASETDLVNANAITDFDLGKTYTWKLTDSFTLSQRIVNGDSDTINANIILDGNGKTITAEKTGLTGNPNYMDYVFYFNRENKMYDKVEIKNLTLTVGDGFRSGIQFSHVNGAGRGVTLSNVTIVMKRTVALIKKQRDQIWRGNREQSLQHYREKQTQDRNRRTFLGGNRHRRQDEYCLSDLRR